MFDLIEDESLREKRHIFKDRREAGIRLADLLEHELSPDPLIMAIPSGGIPVAGEVSRSLNLQLDVVIVRKIQFPYNPEAGFGAVTPDGSAVYKEGLVSRMGLTDEQVEKQREISYESVLARNADFREGRGYSDIEGRNILLVDDGLASGSTMAAASSFVKQKGAKKIIVAVPTASPEAIDYLSDRVDRIFCLNVRSSPVFAVADAYRQWRDLTEEEALELFKEYRE